MDERFQVTDPPRTTVGGLSAELPLITLAWRALRAEHQRRTEERERRLVEDEQVCRMFVRVADEMHRLRRVAREIPAGEVLARQALEGAADRLRSALDDAGILVHAPEGEFYGEALMELLDNVAQRPDPGSPIPRVAEVISPAVTRKDELLRMGKAVIGVPVAQNAVQNPPSPDAAPDKASERTET